MPPILPYVINALLYSAVGFMLVRDMSRQPTTPPAAPRGMPRPTHFLVLVPLALHTSLLARAMFSGGEMYMSVGIALSTIVWLSVLIYWIGNFFYRLEGVHALVIPVAAVGVLMPFVFPPSKPLANAGMPFFRMHLVISMLAYSFFTIASLHVLLMAVLEKRLHAGSLPPLLRGLPPLLAMERLLFRIIAAGFALLTLTLASGMLFSEELFGKPLQFSHKVIFGILAWIIFGTLLFGRLRWGWRGRIAQRWTLTGFLVLLLAYIGAKFVVEVILHR
jgi:ABC-type uncharacterized transport system permease subunit